MDRVGRSCFLAIVDVLVYIEKAQLSELPVLESHASRCYVHKQPKEPTFIIYSFWFIYYLQLTDHDRHLITWIYPILVTATLASYKPNTAFLKYMYIYSFAAYFFVYTWLC